MAGDGVSQGDGGEATSLEKPGMETWPLGAPRSTQSSRGDSGCSTRVPQATRPRFWCRSAAPVLFSAGQRLLHHRHHLPLRQRGAVPAAAAGPGRVPQRRRLAPVRFHSGTSLLQLKPVTPKPSWCPPHPGTVLLGPCWWLGVTMGSPEIPVCSCVTAQTTLPFWSRRMLFTKVISL